MQKIDGLRPKTAYLFDAYCGRGHDWRLKWNVPRAVETWDGDKMGYMGNSRNRADRKNQAIAGRILFAE